MLLLIVLAGFASFVSVIVATIDIVQSPRDIAGKALWLVGLWLVRGFLAAAAYYFIEVRKRPD